MATGLRIFRLGLIFLVLTALATRDSYAQTSPVIPVTYFKLDNGLKVVLSPNSMTPIVNVGVYYNIGCRTEPKNRTGFAHLFEHMMFQGSQNMGKMEFIQLVENNGGILNGSTGYDFTNYFAVMPSNKLETILWAEADRMKGLQVTQENLINQQNVVKNEIRVNVLNLPYGGFPWLDMPQFANENWFNSHNTYGFFSDLDSASLDDVSGFFKTYYVPNNAVLVITGDFEIAEAKKWATQYFKDIPAGKLPPPPDISEPRQEKEKRFSKPDSLASRPAIAIGYKMPPRNSPELFAMALIHQILLEGNDGIFNQVLVQEKGYTSKVNGVFHEGDLFDSNGPMLWTIDLIHDSTVTADQILEQFDKIIENVSTSATQEMLNLAIVKQRSALFETFDGFFGLGKLGLLAGFALFDDNPSFINKLEQSFRDVTLDLLKKTAKEYLRSTNRTILTIEPKAVKS